MTKHANTRLLLPPNAPRSTIVSSRVLRSWRLRAFAAVAFAVFAGVVAIAESSIDWLCITVATLALIGLWLLLRYQARWGSYAFDREQIWVRFGSSWRGPVDLSKVILIDHEYGQLTSYFILFESPQGSDDRGFSASPSRQTRQVGGEELGKGFLIPIGDRWPSVWDEVVPRLRACSAPHTRQLDGFLERYASAS